MILILASRQCAYHAIFKKTKGTHTAPRLWGVSCLQLYLYYEVSPNKSGSSWAFLASEPRPEILERGPTLAQDICRLSVDTGYCTSSANCAVYVRRLREGDRISKILCSLSHVSRFIFSRSNFICLPSSEELFPMRGFLVHLSTAWFRSYSRVVPGIVSGSITFRHSCSYSRCQSEQGEHIPHWDSGRCCRSAVRDEFALFSRNIQREKPV